MTGSAASISVDSGSRARRLGASLLAACIGLALVYLAGLADADLLHDVAHDSRHSLSFPCH